MISEQTKNKIINRPPPSPEVIDKLNKSEQEAEDLVLRNIKCPSCNFVVGKVFRMQRDTLELSVQNVNLTKQSICYIFAVLRVLEN